MLSIARQHLDRLKHGTIDKDNRQSVTSFLRNNTKMAGSAFSFKGHEYQKKILDDPAKLVCTRKCSQVGLTELSVRLALAMCGLNRSFTVIYTVPTAGFATTLTRTRIDPIIESSPLLKSLIHKTTDNSEVKRFGDSYLYIRGSQSTNAPISIPADMLIHDELDFSDGEIIDQYHSRLTHSPHKRKFKLSTPTVPGYGIDAEFKHSKRHFLFAKCDKCNHKFVPNYYEDLVIPDMPVTSSIMNITRNNLDHYDYASAKLLCPSCRKPVDLVRSKREWVVENPTDSYQMSGYQVSPFDAPTIISYGDLIAASVAYARRVDFVNFNLGLPMEDAESGLSYEDIKAGITVSSIENSQLNVMGIDLGLTCHVLIGALSLIENVEHLRIIHTEQVPVHQLRVRKKELCSLYHVRCVVTDNQPFTETVMAMQNDDPAMYGAFYTSIATLEPYMLKKDNNLNQYNQVNINKDIVMDVVMDQLRVGTITKRSCTLDKLFIEHVLSMKRVKVFDMRGESRFSWRKPKNGDDHFWHSLIYLYVAANIVRGKFVNRTALPLLTKFRIKPKPLCT